MVRRTSALLVAAAALLSAAATHDQYAPASVLADEAEDAEDAGTAGGHTPRGLRPATRWPAGSGGPLGPGREGPADVADGVH
ncbi:hypothetical protein, partial [Streptomyces sp. CBMA156]|uniref:hypothetical protein n=1 Tax=Streptomyces sp. CBMA156 TaxID=1930280 RepID=UPI001CB83A2A